MDASANCTPFCAQPLQAVIRLLLQWNSGNPQKQQTKVGWFLFVRSHGFRIVVTAQRIEGRGGRK